MDSLKIIAFSHSNNMIASILFDGGWNGKASKEIFEAIDTEDFQKATSLLKANGWKGEPTY